jgi:hypothetical protein
MTQPPWFNRDTNKSKFLAALWEVRHLVTSAEATLPCTKKPGSHLLLHAIKNRIDDYAECEFGNREYFWNRPHKAG